MLRVPQALHQQVIAHCQRQSPQEACGILAGHRMPQPGQAGEVVAVYPMTNVEESAIGYAMDPKEQLALERTMRDRGQRLLGIYHSHTATDASPSSVDVSLAISPDVSYVLVSLKDRQRPVLKSYRIDGAGVTAEGVVVDNARTVDVRDMLCAQALAVVAEASKQLGVGETLEVRHNAADVRRDLLIWARERGYGIREETGAIWMARRAPQRDHAR